MRRAIVAVFALVACRSPDERAMAALRGRAPASEVVSLAGDRGWSRVTVVRSVGEERRTYSGRNFGTYSMWFVDHFLSLEGREPLSVPLTGSSGHAGPDLRALAAQRWALRASPDGDCVALRTESQSDWEYIWLDRETIACEHIRGDAPVDAPCRDALPLPRLAEALLGGPEARAHHPHAPSANELYWAVTYAAHHPESPGLVTSVARAFVEPGYAVEGASIDLAMLQPEVCNALRGAVATSPEARRVLIDALAHGDVAWRYAGSNAAQLLSRSGADAASALAPLLAIEFQTVRGSRDGNFRRNVAYALGRIGDAERHLPGDVVTAMIAAFGHEDRDATPALFLLRGLAAVDDPSARAAIAARAAGSTETTPWPATFEAYETLVARTPIGARSALIARLARGLADGARNP